MVFMSPHQLKTVLKKSGFSPLLQGAVGNRLDSLQNHPSPSSRRKEVLLPTSGQFHIHFSDDGWTVRRIHQGSGLAVQRRCQNLRDDRTADRQAKLEVTFG